MTIMSKWDKANQTLAALTGLTARKFVLTSLQKSIEWSTPREIYNQLDREFHFDFDPCPVNPTENGIFIEWGRRNFVNPPYNKAITGWLEKARIEKDKGNLSVFLLPSRTDVRWFHDIVLRHADEIRFIRSRLFFGVNRTKPAPFPSIIVIFRGDSNDKS